ncbi:MAG: hypothetical protein GF330_01810, partial [Candidatus Eisenbacteria bacterium]|nr:hypothetical protein [Candidatus Eisenbacteria bacterium]
MTATTRRWIGRLARVLGIVLLCALVLAAWSWREERRRVVSLAQRSPPAWVTRVASETRPQTTLAGARDSADAAILHRARADYGAGHHALALVTLEDYLAESPGDDEARFYAGVAALAAGSGRRALEHLQA